MYKIDSVFVKFLFSYLIKNGQSVALSFWWNSPSNEPSHDSRNDLEVPKPVKNSTSVFENSFSLTACVSLATTSFWFDYLTESPPRAAVPCRSPVRPELADTELSFFLSAFSVYCCKWLSKRLACRLGTVISVHLLAMHISCIAHVRWFGQFGPCVKVDVISSIAVAVIAAHPPVPRSPHDKWPSYEEKTKTPNAYIWVAYNYRRLFIDIAAIWRRWNKSDKLTELDGVSTSVCR
jgi:hypothetical protein